MMNKLLSGIIDYAGLFPPAKLSLEETINNYISYKNSKHSHLLARLILPETLLEEAYLKLNKLNYKVALSLLTNNPSEQLKIISKFTNMFILENIEEKIANVYDLEKSISKAYDLIETINLKIFFELDNVLFRDSWENEITTHLSYLNKYKSNKLGLKIRCGGVTPDLIPSSDRLAKYISLAAENNTPIKFTAGLHHPLKAYHENFAGSMHGFLNVYFATLFAYKLKISTKQIISILEASSINEFEITLDSLKWQGLVISSNEVEKLRNEAIYSFGSCSFLEPIDDLKELKLLE